MILLVSLAAFLVGCGEETYTPKPGAKGSAHGARKIKD